MSAKSPDGKPIDLEENRRRMENGEYYYAFTPDLIKDRKRCIIAMKKFNRTDHPTRREMITMWNDIVGDTSTLPEQKPLEEDDDAQLEDYPWVEGPVRMDYGYNIKLGKNVFINANSTWIDTCTITIGDRVMFGPGVSLYSGGHPVDYRVRNGISGPEFGGKITIGDDCWIGGNVIILPGITIGRGTTIGAGSVVTKDIPEECVAVGNPCRVIKKIDTSKPPVTI